MVENTVLVNSTRIQFDDSRPIWLFGYGSLIFKADFPFLQKQPASIVGWKRRFWQGSHDHRGTSSSPGRVVTLIESPDSLCRGMAYLIDTDTLGHLDYREKNGYLRFVSTLTFDDGSTADGLVYIATSQNKAWLGEAPPRVMAQQIAESIGPSGRNMDYLMELADALRALSAEDDHVFEVERHTIAYCAEKQSDERIGH